MDMEGGWGSKPIEAEKASESSEAFCLTPPAFFANLWPTFVFNE